ncbi:WXG100 family type VII secretion target [Antribacter gilvus]|uniref:WXG100 family type VII secretion target n=1 Tax=Antribacter gilvus TaxID=2304675 RepID=UPI0013DFB4C3|nr:WXG100 family type VII secretion target [Antribacter gilvus]
MGDGMYGADVSELRALARTLDRKAGDLQSAAQNVTSLLKGIRWEGPNADSFRREWAGKLEPSVRQAAHALDEASGKLQTNANAQEQTSTTYAGDGGGGPGDGGPGGGGHPGGGGDGTTTASGNGGPPDWLVPPSDLTTEMTRGGVYNTLANLGTEAWKNFNKLDDVFDVGGLTKSLTTVGNVLGAAGFIFDGYSVYSGAVQAWEGFAEGDGYKGTDGVITAGLGAAGIGAAIFLASNPVGWAIAGAGAVWGIATLLSGDVPVTKRIADAGGWLLDRGGDLAGGISNVAGNVADGVGEAAGDVVDAGKDFVDGAKDTIKKAWPF